MDTWAPSAPTASASSEDDGEDGTSSGSGHSEFHWLASLRPETTTAEARDMARYSAAG